MRELVRARYSSVKLRGSTAVQYEEKQKPECKMRQFKYIHKIKTGVFEQGALER